MTPPVAAVPWWHFSLILGYRYGRWDSFMSFSIGSIDLGKVNDQGSPVWRMAVSVPHPTGPDIASTAESELLAAGPGSPVFNQLVDVNSPTFIAGSGLERQIHQERRSATAFASGAEQDRPAHGVQAG